MASYNNITLLGHIGSVQVKTFPNGGKIVEATLATSKVWYDRNGEKHEDTQWHRLVVGGPLADTAEKYVTKGNPLFVTGEMTYREYTNADGVKKTIPEVKVQALQLLPKGVKENGGSARTEIAPAPIVEPAPVYEKLDLPY